MRFRLLAFLTTAVLTPLLAPAQTAPFARGASGAAQPPAPSAAQEAREQTLPIRSVSLYTNGVAFIELAGTVHGDALIRLDLTAAQLNDAVSSLTAWDLNGGTVTGSGYHTAPSAGGELHTLLPGLPPNPTSLDVLRALKGKSVEVRTGPAIVTGRILNVELRTDAPSRLPGAPAVPATRRFLSLVSDNGSLRTVELTPATEVRVLGREGQALTRSLHLLDSETAAPDKVHLTLEDRGTGTRELHISYLTQAPAWKSTYRVQFDAKSSTTAALQGFAVLDNTSADDWKDVDLTLVSGAPQSFVQQIARPLTFMRQQVPMPVPGGTAHLSAMPLNAIADPLLGQATSAARAGGDGFERQAVRPAPAEATAARDSRTSEEPLALPSGPATTSDLGDLFEFHLARPVSLAAGQSLTVPILQTQLAVDRVSVWSPHEKPRPAMRALYFTNATGLTLDRGSLTVLVGNAFAGEGELDLTHPAQRQLVRYGTDESIQVSEFKPWKSPEPYIRHYEVKDGVLTVHRRNVAERDFHIRNTGANPATVVIQITGTDRWNPEPSATQPVERVGNLDRFTVPTTPAAETQFRFLESHSSPAHYKLAELSEQDIRQLMTQTGNDPGFTALLQPFLDARKQLAEFARNLQRNDEAAHRAEAEEARIRANMAALPAKPDPSLVRLYSGEMTQQENLLGTLRQQKEELLRKQHTIQDATVSNAAALPSADIKLRG